jgi:hypothetical protein
MSERSDRTIRGNRFLLVLIIMVSVLVPGGLIIWSRMGPPVLPQTDAVRHDIARVRTVRTDEPLRVMVYCPTAGMLVAESAGVRRQPDAQSQARETVSALLTSSCPGQAPVLKGLRLNALYLDPSGTAYVDLSAAGPMDDGRGSVWDEFLAVYAMVNTLMQNFEDVKQVHFLVDGKEAKTLAGHIDMSPFFSRRMDLVQQ